MKAPEQFDPSKPNSQSSMPPPSSAPANQLAKSPDIPAGMPTIKQTHKQTVPPHKRPFEWSFLMPKYWGIWLLMAVILPLIYLSLRWQFWLGRKLGILIYKTVGSRRRDTLINLRLAFPEKPEAERELMAKQIFVNQGIGVFETLCAWFRPNVFTRTVSISGLQHVVNAQNEGRAVILLGAHYTMLDLGGMLCTQFFPMDGMYRPQNNALLDWVVYNGRSNILGKQISNRDMRSLVSSIKDGHVIWYSPDQDYGLKQGVMAPFFGVPAATLTATRRLANLGSKEHPPAVMALHTYRQTPDNMPSGKRPHYHLTITPALDSYPSNDEVADATRVNEVLEGLIRIDPTQWMWFHRRFKNGPEGRTDIYD
ncbi:lipid A biosynthesis acyltransferase [Psychrobacter frigidicola]|uniref:LpxL/LpxP family acyltransferase n=1 Tax=Psychrobacter frigidicola TaxID=45611 RepID=UPI001919FA14|nr:lipid A biosynthesis acyltransferase [Psychrobacter frigidicola]